MSKKVLIRAYIHVHTKYIICRSLKIIFIVFKVLVYTSKNNTDYALKVHLYSLIKVDDLRPSCTQIGRGMKEDQPFFNPKSQRIFKIFLRVCEFK